MASNTLTYTTVGSFNENGIFTLAAYLPNLQNLNRYLFAPYNLSTKKANTGDHLNVIFINLVVEPETGRELEWTYQDTLKTIAAINTANLDNTYAGSSFNCYSREALVVMYHDAEFNPQNDLRDVYKKAEGWYDAVILKGPHNIREQLTPEKEPKRLGMSIIKRTT